MARTHLSITVELVHGSHTGDLWPRPGRVLIAARTTTFEKFATAIEDAFARWDRSHLHEFTLADGTLITPARWWDGEEPEGSLDGAKVRLGRLRPGEQFAYVFDLGDNWQHLCTVAPERADPMETLGIIPDQPLPCWGWGDIPDQYGRRWNGDDGTSPRPKAPDGLADLPPILPGWGPASADAPAPRRGHRDPLSRPDQIARRQGTTAASAVAGTYSAAAAGRRPDARWFPGPSRMAGPRRSSFRSRRNRRLPDAHAGARARPLGTPACGPSRRIVPPLL